METNSNVPIINTNQLESNLYMEGTNVSSFISTVHSDFHINRVEDYLNIVNFPTKADIVPRRISVYNFFFLTKGESIRSKGLDAFSFGANTFFFLPAYQITTHQQMDRESEGFYCHFNIELLTDANNIRTLFKEFPFLEFNNYPLVTIDENTKESISFLLNRLLTEYKSGKNCRVDILRTYLFALFTELKPFVETSKPISSNAATTITEQFKNALTKYIYTKTKITDYAEFLSISPNHLNKCVRVTTGKSANDLLNEMLLLEAKVMLKQTNLSVKEIAFTIGKSEVSVFSRFFKNQTGISPSEYRISV